MSGLAGADCRSQDIGYEQLLCNQPARVWILVLPLIVVWPRRPVTFSVPQFSCVDNGGL
jgi:hypothetical protein